MEYEFKLTENEANLVIVSLGKMPYEQVYLLMNKLQQQVSDQQAEQQGDN